MRCQKDPTPSPYETCWEGLMAIRTTSAVSTKPVVHLASALPTTAALWEGGQSLFLIVLSSASDITSSNPAFAAQFFRK